MKNPKDKVIAIIWGDCRVETTFEQIQEYDYNENDDGTYEVNIGGDRLDDALELEPEGFFTESLLCRFKSGYVINFDSNYKLSKEEQEKVNSYSESDSADNYKAEWWCYYDLEKKQTFDEKLIDILSEEFEKADGFYNSPNCLQLKRLDPSDFLKDFKYYWE